MPSGAEKFTPDDDENGPEMFDTETPSICNVEEVMAFGPETFQLILPFVCETTTWLIAGPVTVNEPLLVVELLAESIAVMRKPCRPAATGPIGPEKFTPPDAPVNGPATPCDKTPSICSVELTTAFGPETFQLILPVVCETTTWLIVSCVAAASIAATVFGAATSGVDSPASELAKSAA